MSRRIKMTQDILKMMQNPKQIRNIGLIGHIDHGKTTLSDSLLAEAGLLSEALAGEARVLDYLEEEQRRGITMKSANVSLYYEHSLKGAKPFLINLVDTPGHLDFSGKVTRALRLIDGVVVIVDAVEEISSQTETVVRQALEEAVKPILFINKIDRLFRELKLEMEQIKEKFSRIISEFNLLIEMYGDERAKKTWKVSAEKGSVIFGSALHKWGFVVPQLQKMNKTFSYFQEHYEKETYKELVKEFPVWEAVLAAIVTFLPDPLTAQKYRIPVIWDGNLDSKMGKALQACDANGPTIVCLSRVQRIKGRLVATGRIFSGSLKKGQMLWLVNQKKKVPLNRLSIFMGARLENVDKIPAGNIAALSDVPHVKSGETIVETSLKDIAEPFSDVKYVSEPVVTVAVEPDMLKNLNKLEEILKEIMIEDPNISVEISNETGECLVSGMGPLHLEIVANMIKERGVNVEVSKPSSVFRESIMKNSQSFSAQSPNGKNTITLHLERLNDDTVRFLRSVSSSVVENDYKRIKVLTKDSHFSEEEAKNVWNIDRYQNVLIVCGSQDSASDLERKKGNAKNRSRSHNKSQSLLLSKRKEIVKIFKELTAHGPLAYEPLGELKIVVETLSLSSEHDEANYFELSTMCQNAFKQALTDAEPVLLEPIYKLIITTPENYIGTVTSLITQHQGKIEKINQDQFRAYIYAKMSVRESIGFVEEVRSETSGRVFWQAIFDRFEPVPEHKKEELINDIKFRKGYLFS